MNKSEAGKYINPYSYDLFHLWNSTRDAALYYEFHQNINATLEATLEDRLIQDLWFWGRSFEIPLEFWWQERK